jgi:hypothetical protein
VGSLRWSNTGRSADFLADEVGELLAGRVGCKPDEERRQQQEQTKLVDGVPVAEVVAKGEAEIGIQQINVILPVANADYVGPLPAELKGYVEFAVGGFAGAQPRLRTASASQFYE